MNTIALSIVLACLMAGPAAADNRQKSFLAYESPAPQKHFLTAEDWQPPAGERKPFEKVAPKTFLPDLPVASAADKAMSRSIVVGPTSDGDIDATKAPSRSVVVGPTSDGVDRETLERNFKERQSGGENASEMLERSQIGGGHE
jgi:hypothetical protein